MDKKIGVLFSVLIISIICSSIISAGLEIQKEEVSSMAVRDLNLPAIFNLQITNNGVGDTFSLHSYAGVDILPTNSFFIDSGETKEVTLEAYPNVPLKISPDYLSFEYEIKSSNGVALTDQLAISMVNLRDAFNFYIEDIDPESSVAKVHWDNKAGHTFEGLEIELTSGFFSDTRVITLNSKEAINYDVTIDKEKAKELFAGPYIVNAVLKIDDFSTETSTILQFNERPGIESSESKEGVLARRYELVKTNNGNVKTEVAIYVTRNLFSALFTRFNIAPTTSEFHGLKKTYLFQKELDPGQSLKVVVNTNWWILIGIIVLALVIWYFMDRYIKAKVVLTKKIFPVRTKGGEFALKVTIKVKARDFVEKIRIYDKLPPMVKVFERFGLNAPDKVDSGSRRLEWDIQALSKGEERIFDYIVYSKIGLVGNFEVPPAEAVYEFEGQIKDAKSNSVSFNNESGAKKGI